MADKPIIGIDLDGTVLDCRQRHQAVTCRLIPEVTQYFDVLWALKRDGYSTRAAIEQMGLEVPMNFEQNWMELIEHPTYLGLDSLMPNTDAALQILTQTANLHLITSRQNARGVTNTLSRLCIAHHFSQVIVVGICSEAIKAKTKYLSTNKAIAHCGDTEVDAQSAAYAKIPFWGVTSGQRSKNFLLAWVHPARLAPSLYAIAVAGL